MFRVEYFEAKRAVLRTCAPPFCQTWLCQGSAYLAQSPQLYKQMALMTDML